MKPSRASTTLVISGLVLITVIAFEGVRHNGFIFDDAMYITRNPNVQAGITPESVAWAFSTPHMGSWHPVTWLSHMWDCTLFGLNATGHHVVNLLFHLVNVVLLFYVLVRLTGAVWPSLFVAAAFAVHPLRVESVAWVAERKDVLSGTFWMLAMAAYVRYVERPGLARYLLVAVTLAIGLMAKPMLVTLPFVLLLLDYWPMDRLKAAPQVVGGESPRGSRNRRAKSLSSLIAEKIPLLCIVALFAVITLVVQRSQGAMAMLEAGHLPLSVRLGNAVVSYVSYIVKTFYPVGLAVFYPHRGDDLPMFHVVAAFVILLVTTLAVVYAARRDKRYAVTGWLWYLGTLVPVIGLVQVGEQAMADRYTYLPSIGLLIMVAWGARDVFAGWPSRRAALGLVTGIVLVALVASTRAHVRYWRNGVTLYSRALEVTENNYLALYNLGRAELLEGKTDDAIEHLERTMQLLPSNVDVRNNLGVALRRKGRYAEAIEQFEEAIRIRPDYARAHYNLGFAQANQGRIDEAIRHCEDALRINPDFADAMKLREQLLEMRGQQ